MRDDTCKSRRGQDSKRVAEWVHQTWYRPLQRTRRWHPEPGITCSWPFRAGPWIHTPALQNNTNFRIGSLVVCRAGVASTQLRVGIRAFCCSRCRRAYLHREHRGTWWVGRTRDGAPAGSNAAGGQGVSCREGGRWACWFFRCVWRVLLPDLCLRALGRCTYPLIDKTISCRCNSWHQPRSERIMNNDDLWPYVVMCNFAAATSICNSTPATLFLPP